MVYFTCNNCGSSLKKNTVEKHYNGCRRPIALTCVDCLKDFFGQDYTGHTSCLTEDEKYSAKGFQSKPPSNKGEMKQQAWVEVVHHTCKTTQDLPQLEQQLITQLLKQSNIPQKKNKFKNFVHSFWRQGRFNEAVVDAVFDLLDSAYKAVREKESVKSTGNGGCKQEAQEKEKEEIEEMSEAINADVLLSKKEKKEKRKRDKYEAELKAAEKLLEPAEEDATNSRDDEGSKKRKKKKNKGVEITLDLQAPAEEKSKKRKKCLSEVEENGKDALVDGTKKSKKMKKKQMEEEDGEHEDKMMESKASNKTPKDDNSNSALKFDWSDMILRVLTETEDKKLSVKRLRKKVVAEYATLGGGHDTENKVLAKFNKKLSKTPGVVVLKDIARIKC